MQSKRKSARTCAIGRALYFSSPVQRFPELPQASRALSKADPRAPIGSIQTVLQSLVPRGHLATYSATLHAPLELVAGTGSVLGLFWVIVPHRPASQLISDLIVKYQGACLQIFWLGKASPIFIHWDCCTWLCAALSVWSRLCFQLEMDTLTSYGVRRDLRDHLRHFTPLEHWLLMLLV